jgi:hypothetical protein
MKGSDRLPQFFWIIAEAPSVRDETKGLLGQNNKQKTKKQTAKQQQQ